MSGGSLQNLGQTCAINSLVQIIAHSPRLREAILDSPAYKDGKNGKDEERITWEIGDVIDKIYSKKQHTSPGGLVGVIFRSFPHDLVPGEQHDICELWMLLSSRIADEICKCACAPATHAVNVIPICPPSANVQSKVMKFLGGMYAKSWSPWLEQIVGVELSIVQCNACKDQPWSPEVYTILPLDIEYSGSGANGTTIEQLLLRHFQIEDLTDWSCDKCKLLNTGGKKQNKLYSLPPVLMVSLKRFRMSTGGRFSKVHAPITISDQLMFEIGGSMKRYALRGVGNHYGSYNFGHYTAFVNEDGAGRWVCYDDTNVIALPDCSFLKHNKDAYILCYEHT